MKFVILIAVVLIVLWLMRSKRSSGERKVPPREAQAKVEPPQDMVRCPVCSVHLPRSDALPGPGGQLYCCAEHRLRAGA